MSLVALLILIGKLQNMNYFPIENSSLMSHKSGHSSLFAIETYCSIFSDATAHAQVL